MTTSVILVVPCYNEAARLDCAAFRGFRLRNARLQFCFVNDGSRDATLRILHELCDGDAPLGFVVDLAPNQGKAEAVRRGMLAAIDRAPSYVGFWDADLATPLAELESFLSTLAERPEIEMVIGSRVKLLGRRIERSPLRHYLGRVFATAASMALGLAVYDTQCGAKLFRVNEALRAVLAVPFRVNWTFDVELIARFAQYYGSAGRPIAERICEQPLTRWNDVPGSKVRPFDFVRAGRELWTVWRAYPRRAGRKSP